MRVIKAFLVLILSVVLVVLLFRGWTERVMQERVLALPRYQIIGDFDLVNQNGESFSRETLKDKVWIADFIFTRCGGPCPVMTRNMKKIQESLVGNNFRLVSFSVDPEYDSPAVLKRYAQKFEIDESSWSFLTGEKEKIYDLAVRSFLLGVDNAEEGEGKRSHIVMHSTKFVLVDAEGSVRGYYDGMDPEELERLIRDTNGLIKYS